MMYPFATLAVLTACARAVLHSRSATDRQTSNLRRSARRVANGVDDDAIHVVMLSDRQVAAAASLQSVCANTATPSRLHLHLIGPSGDWDLSSTSPACAGSANISQYTIDELTEELIQSGLKPVWLWNDTGREYSGLSVHPAEWDNSTIHMDPFNLMRFYLPQVEPFKHMRMVLLLDDDVIILKDVAKAWEQPLNASAIMTASCHNWVWNSCDEFQSGTNFTYLDVPYLGFGHVGSDRSVAAATCNLETDQECIPKGLLTFLENKSVEINGPEHQISMHTLRHATAWNYGFNKISLRAWRNRGITHKFIEWMRLNHEFKLFPTTSVAFGLGIAMLTKIGHVQCLEGEMDVVQGLGFVSPRDVRAAGLTKQTMLDSFGLHYNGPQKPWDYSSGNPYASFFLEYAPADVSKRFRAETKQHVQRRHARDTSNSTSFVLITDPRSGGEWLMDLLDSHPEICASGEAADETSGFPRDGLLPGSHVHLSRLEEVHSGPSTNLLALDAETASPRNFYTPSRMESVSVEAPVDASLELKTCQVKAGCSWARLSKFVWRAVHHPSVCSAHRQQTAHQRRHGINKHLDVVCSLHDHAVKRLGLKANHTNPSKLYEHVFRVFLRQQLRFSLTTNDGEFDSGKESRQVLPCRCPRSKMVVGQKLYHEWLGDMPVEPFTPEDWQARPWGVNFNVEGARARGMPYLDLIGTMKELGTKAIVLRREDTLARFVSMKSVEQTKVKQCTTAECVKKVQAAKVEVEPTELEQFSELSQVRRQRTQSLLEAAGIQTLELSYEACAADAHVCVARIAEFLQVSEPAAAIAEASELKKMLLAPEEQVSNYHELQLAQLMTPGMLDLPDTVDW